MLKSYFSITTMLLNLKETILLYFVKAVIMSVKVTVRSSETGLTFLASKPSQTFDYIKFIEFEVSNFELSLIYYPTILCSEL